MEVRWDGGRLVLCRRQSLASSPHTHWIGPDGEDGRARQAEQCGEKGTGRGGHAGGRSVREKRGRWMVISQSVITGYSYSIQRCNAAPTGSPQLELELTYIYTCDGRQLQRYSAIALVT